MIIKSSFDAVERSIFSKGFLRPRHADWCFSRIPDTLRSLLLERQSQLIPLPKEALVGDGIKFKKVLFIFVDGLGWRFFEETLAEHPLFRRFNNQGHVVKLTSQFPSTTVVHVASMTTGLNVDQAALIDWFYYEPNVGEVIAPLLFSFAGDRSPDTLVREGFDPYLVFPRSSLSTEFASQGVKTYAYQNRSYTPSTFSKATMPHAKLIPFDTVSDGIDHMLSRIGREERAFHYLYIDTVDRISHLHGPSDPVSQTESRSIMTLLEKKIFSAANASLKDVLVVLTADHGSVDICAEDTIYLNTIWPQLGSLLKENRRGGAIVPSGCEGRNMFLHVKPEFLSEVRLKLETLLEGRAEVLSISEMASDGFFGLGPPSIRFLERAGDLVILPYEGESVWWYEKDKFEIRHRGNHGGLTRKEMEIPLLSAIL